jgi:hypothetical protein
MLAKSLIDQIDRLLREGGLSQRKIAARLRVSRGTVAAIASGRRGLYGREAGDETSSALTPHSPPERCPHCGYRVYAPCLICRSRDFQQRQQELRLAVESLRPATTNGNAPRQGEGETRRHGDDDATRTPAHLLVSHSPCLLVFDPPPFHVPVRTVMPVIAATPT